MSRASLITESLVCETLGITSADIDKMIQRGEIPKPNSFAGSYVFPYEWFAEKTGLRRCEIPEASKREVQVKIYERQIAEEQRKIDRLLTIKKRMERDCATHWADIMRMEQFLECNAPAYPAIPHPEGWDVTKEAPKESGVYFLWSENKNALAYVGQSVNINARLRGHSRLLLTDSITWLLFPVADITHAEAYYIGIGKPYRNGAVNAAELFKHRRDRRDVPTP